MRKLTGVLSCLSAFLLVAQLAVAGEVFRPEQVGAIEAVFDSCAKVDPRLRGGLEVKQKKMFEGMSHAMLKQARETKEYSAGYRALTSVLRDEIPRVELAAACAAI